MHYHKNRLPKLRNCVKLKLEENEVLEGKYLGIKRKAGKRYHVFVQFKLYQTCSKPKIVLRNVVLSDYWVLTLKLTEAPRGALMRIKRGKTRISKVQKREVFMFEVSYWNEVGNE